MSISRNTPLKRKTPIRRKGWLAQASRKRTKQLRQYYAQRREFLSRPENQWCPVAAAGLVLGELGAPKLRIRTTDVHHIAGREGKLLCDESKWLAVSRGGHDWIHAHPNAARLRGWLAGSQTDPSSATREEKP